MKKIVVACAGAVATSTIAAEEIRELCNANHIKVDIVQCRLAEIETYASDAALICSTARLDRTFGSVPVVHGMAFVSGIGIEEVSKSIIDILKD